MSEMIGQYLWYISPSPLVPHICVTELGHHWIRWWLGTCLAPSHYLNQWWLLINHIPHSRRRRPCSKVSLGHLTGRRDQYPAVTSRLRMVRTDTRLLNRHIICIRRRGAEMKRFVLTIQSSWRSSRGVEILIEPPRFIWCGRPVSVASQNFVYASLRQPQHPGYFSLIIANCQQLLLWQILWHDPL